MKNKLRNIALYLIIILIIWLPITSIIQAFKCAEMTQTELFLHIPNSYILDFKNCL